MDGVEISGIRKIFDLVQGMTGAIDLSIGQAHFDSPPGVKEAAKAAIDDGFNRYTVTQGIPELNEKLRVRLRKRFGLQGGGTLITSGCAGGIFEAFMVLVDEGDEVIVPDPYFVIYCHLVRICGGKPVLLDTYPDFRVRAAELEKLITPRTKAILINTPSNPTGIALRAEELSDIAAVAKKHDLLIISDEIYDAFHYNGGHESMCRHYENTLLLGGFSKTYAIPGWRLGFAAGPPDIIEQMTMFQQFSFVCANAPAQRAALRMLDTDMSEYLSPYRTKRDIVYDGLRDVFECVRPDGAFYIFPKCPDGVTDEEFVRRAIENKVLIVPGSAASRRNTHFRLSFAAPDDDLKRGVDILRGLAVS